MLSYTRLSGNVRRFKTLIGMSLQEFNLLFAKVEKAHPEMEKERLSQRPRRRAIGAGRRFALDLRNRVPLLLFYGADHKFVQSGAAFLWANLSMSSLNLTVR